ncbi:unnamed protein product [Chrysoparadoxa australica]
MLLTHQVCCESMRERAVGQVTVVQKLHPAPLHVSLSWLLLLFLTATLAIFTWCRLGPVSCACSVSLWCSNAILRRRDAQPGSAASRTLLLLLPPALWLAWLMPAMRSFHPSLVALGCTLAAAAVALILIWPFEETPHWCKHALLACQGWTIPSLPRPVIPPVIQFDQEELADMFEVKTQLCDEEVTRGLIQRNWVANSYAEAAMSFVLPCCLYNSHRFRHTAHIFLSYLLPVSTVLQGLGALVPFLHSHTAVLLASANSDAGLKILAAMIRLLGGGVGTMAGLVGRSVTWGGRASAGLMHQGALRLIRAWASPLLLAVRSASFAGKLRTGRCWFGGVASAVMEGLWGLATLVTVLFRRCLIPMEFVLVYIKAQLMPVRYILKSSQSMWLALVSWSKGAGECAALLLAKALEGMKEVMSTSFLELRQAALVVSTDALQTCYLLVSNGLAMAQKTFTATFIQVCNVMQWLVFRPFVAPNVAQVSLKVADGGKKFYTNVSLSNTPGPAKRGGSRRVRCMSDAVHRTGRKCLEQRFNAEAEADWVEDCPKGSPLTGLTYLVERHFRDASPSSSTPPSHPISPEASPGFGDIGLVTPPRRTRLSGPGTSPVVGITPFTA